MKVEDARGRPVGHSDITAAWLWRENVFDDDMPTDQKLAYLKEFAATLRENIAETSKDLIKLERAIKRIE